MTDFVNSKISLLPLILTVPLILTFSCNRKGETHFSCNNCKVSEGKCVEKGKIDSHKVKKPVKLRTISPKVLKEFKCIKSFKSTGYKNNQGETPYHRHLLNYEFPKYPWRLEKLRKWGKPRITAPIVSNSEDIIYFGDHRGIFRAFNIKTKKILWHVKTGGKIWARAFLGRKKIYFGSDDDNLYGVDYKTGKIAWKKKAFICNPKKSTDPENVRCDVDTPVIMLKDKTIIFGGKGVGAIDSEGNLLWKYDITSHVRSSFGLDSYENIYFATLKGEIISLTSTGNLRWKYKTKGQCDSTIFMGDNCTVLVGCDDHILYALNEETGKVKWRLIGGKQFRSGGAASGDRNIYWGNLDGYLYKISYSGAVLWRYNTGARILTPPLVDKNGNILIVPEKKRLILLSGKGKLLYSHKIPSISDSVPVVLKSGGVVLTSESGYVLIYQTQ